MTRAITEPVNKVSLLVIASSRKDMFDRIPSHYELSSRLLAPTGPWRLQGENRTSGLTERLAGCCFLAIPV